MADVMNSIANLFSRPTTLWGFNALEREEDAPIKIENDQNENKYEFVVMETGDDSDSDIEIVGFTQGRTTSTVPQRRQPESAWRSTSTSVNANASEHGGRKRKESPVELSANESPKKKTNANVNGDRRETALSGRFTATAQSPTRPRPSTSLIDSPSSRKKLLLGGTLDFAGSYHSMSAAVPVSVSPQGHNATKSKLLDSISSTDPSVTNRGTTSTNRMKIPFDDDDSDEDFHEPQPPTRQPGTTSMFNRMWSQPQSQPQPQAPAADATPKPSATTDRARNHIKAIHDQARRNAASRPGSITYEPFKSMSRQSTNGAPVDQTRPESTVKANTDSKPFLTDHRKVNDNRATYKYATQTERAREAELMHSSRFVASRNENFAIGFDVTRTGDLKKGAQPVGPNSDDKHLQGQEASRKKQEEINARTNEGAVQPGIQETGPNIPNGNVTDSSKSLNMVESTHEKGQEAKVPPAFQDLENRKRAEEAANARKQADLRREMEANRRAREKLVAERLQWQSQQRLVEKRRAEERHKQEAAQDEAAIVAERTKALSKLERVKKPTETPEAAKQTNGACNSTLEGLLKDVSARPGMTKTSMLSNEEQQDTARNEPMNDEAPSIQPQALSTNESPLTTSGTAEGQANADRDQRIQQMKERNERLRIAEREREQREEQQSQLEKSNEPSFPMRSQFQPLPRGPVALNSIAGQRMVAESKIDIRKNRADTQSGGSRLDRNQERKPHERKLGEIATEDVDLVTWRDKGMTFGEINQLSKIKGRQPRANDTLRRRYNQVKRAIKDAAISEELLDPLFSGSEQARQEVNRKIHGLPTPASNAIASTQLCNVASGLPVRSMLITHLSLKNNSHSIASAGSSFSSRTLSASPAPSCSQQQHGSPTRPTTGGKTMNEQAFQYYLEAAQEVWEGDAAEKEARSTREPSPFTDEDYATFTYQVERRELCQDSIDEGFSIDDELWVKCSQDFDTVLAANIAAYKQLFRTPKSLIPGVDLSGDREHRVTVNEGMELHELRGSDGGIRQVRVARFMQTYQKGLLPRNKNGWTPRTVFFIKERTVTTSKEMDSLFGEDDEATETVTREVKVDVDNEVYTILDLANEMAIKKFMTMAFTPTSGNLTLRQWEIQQEEARLMKELDENEDGFFHQHVEDDDGDQLEVWVEEGDLKGPRNLD